MLQRGGCESSGKLPEACAELLGEHQEYWKSCGQQRPARSEQRANEGHYAGEVVGEHIDSISRFWFSCAAAMALIEALRTLQSLVLP